MFDKIIFEHFVTKKTKMLVLLQRQDKAKTI